MNTSQTSLRWGLITGVSLISYALIFYLLNTPPNGFFSVLVYVIIFGGIFAAIYFKKKNEQEGFITFGEAFKTGATTALAAAFIIAFFNFILFRFVDPGYVQIIMEQSEKALIERGMPEEQISQSMEMMNKFMTPTMIATMTMFMYTVFGLIFAVIIAAIVRKEKPMFQ